jgi:hypothetical protein
MPTPAGFWDQQISSRSYGAAYSDASGRERVTRDFYEVKTEVRGLLRREGASAMRHGGADSADVAEQARAAEERRRVRELFLVLDTDGSDSLKRGEVAELVRHLGKRLDDAALDAALAEMDKDGSGSVEYDEFVTWWEETGQTQSQHAILNIATARRFIYDVPMFQGKRAIFCPAVKSASCVLGWADVPDWTVSALLRPCGAQIHLYASQDAQAHVVSREPHNNQQGRNRLGNVVHHHWCRGWVHFCKALKLYRTHKLCRVNVATAQRLFSILAGPLLARWGQAASLARQRCSAKSRAMHTFAASPTWKFLCSKNRIYWQPWTHSHPCVTWYFSL